jgi:hypothetical protein
MTTRGGPTHWATTARHLIAELKPRRTEPHMTTTADRIAELRAEADRLEAANCTGLTATWCPTHGDCTCPPLYDGDEEAGRTLNDPRCPLHSTASSHAEDGQP